MCSFTIKLFKLIVFVYLIRIISVFISPPIIHYTTVCVFIYVYMIDNALFIYVIDFIHIMVYNAHNYEKYIK